MKNINLKFRKLYVMLLLIGAAGILKSQVRNEVSVNTSEINFENVSSLDDRSFTLPLTITNNGTENLVITNIPRLHEPFSIVNYKDLELPITILPGNTFEIDIDVNNKYGKGEFKDTLRIYDNIGIIKEISMRVVITAPEIELDTLDIDFLKVNRVKQNEVSAEFFINNRGNENLIISNMENNEDYFICETPDYPIVIKPSEKTKVKVKVNKERPRGKYNDALKINSNDKSMTVNIRVQIVSPEAKYDKELVAFNSVETTDINEHIQKLLISNVGDAEMEVWGIQGLNKGIFYLKNDIKNEIIAENGSKEIEIGFNPPTESGTYTDVMYVNADFGVQMITISANLEEYLRNGDMFNKFNLKNLKPNPAINNTALTYKLNQKENVKIYLLNNSGQKIRDILDREMDEGEYETLINCEGLMSGIYYVRVEVGGLANTLQLSISN